LLKTLAAFVELCAERELCVARELTKQFEEFRIGLPAVLVEHFTAHPPRGEIVLLVRGLNRAELKAARQSARHSEPRP
jgi:16S rRNA (cytidine1402-2'-O)-methyltransferase